MCAWRRGAPQGWRHFLLVGCDTVAVDGVGGGLGIFEVQEDLRRAGMRVRARAVPHM